MKYINKISGPLLDRIDIHIEVPPVNPSFRNQSNGETSEKIRERVNKARDIQTERFKNDKIYCNARENRHIKKYCNPLPEAENLLDLAMRELNLSARAYHRILKVGRTIADLAGGNAILPEHISEAVQYRALDRLEW